MTPQESFRFGFLTRCAEERLTPAEIADRVKFASAGLQKQAASKGWVSGLANALAGGAILPWVGTTVAGAGASMLGGAGIGHGLAKLQDSSADPEDVKRQELVALYKRYADQARMKARQRSYRKPKIPSPQLL